MDEVKIRRMAIWLLTFLFKRYELSEEKRLDAFHRILPFVGNDVLQEVQKLLFAIIGSTDSKTEHSRIAFQAYDLLDFEIRT